MLTLCLPFCGTARLFSKASAPFHISTSRVWGFQFLHILTNPYYYLSFLGLQCVWLNSLSMVTGLGKVNWEAGAPGRGEQHEVPGRLVGELDVWAGVWDKVPGSERGFAKEFGIRRQQQPIKDFNQVSGMTDCSPRLALGAIQIAKWGSRRKRDINQKGVAADWVRNDGKLEDGKGRRQQRSKKGGHNWDIYRQNS